MLCYRDWSILMSCQFFTKLFFGYSFPKNENHALSSIFRSGFQYLLNLLPLVFPQVLSKPPLFESSLVLSLATKWSIDFHHQLQRHKYLATSPCCFITSITPFFPFKFRLSSRYNLRSISFCFSHSRSRILGFLGAGILARGRGLFANL